MRTCPQYKQLGYLLVPLVLKTPQRLSYNWENVLNNFYQLLKPKGMLWINCFDDSKYRRMPINLNKKINNKDRIMVRDLLLLSGWDVGKIKFIQDSFFWKDRIIFNKIKLEKKN